MARLVLATIAPWLVLASACSNFVHTDPSPKKTDSTDTHIAAEEIVTDVESEDAAPDNACIPHCDGKACGDDGCGGSCGSCAPGVVCVDGCGPIPDCAGKECGPDAAGGFCGNGDPETQGCPAGLVCQNGMCEEPCIPSCEGKECGSDGCDGSCGTCPCPTCDWEACACEDGICVPACGECDCMCIFECFEHQCSDGDEDCYQGCVNSATIEAQLVYNNLITCLDQSGYFECGENDEDCLNETFEACMDPYYECFHGDTECVDMYLCVIDCPAGDAGTVCAQVCFASGNVEALKQWDTFLGCLDTEGYFDCPDNDDACVEAAWNACGEEFTACAHGDLTCSEMFECLETCAPTDQICGLSCIVHGTEDAQGQWDAMVDCIVEQCGEQSDPECEASALQGPCADAYGACLGS